MRRSIIIFGVVLITAAVAVLFVRSDFFQHEWYHQWVEPHRHDEAKRYAKALAPLITNDIRFAGVQWFVRVRSHRDPMIRFVGVVQSETALSDLKAAVAARQSPFDVDWQIGVTNTPTQ